MFSRDEAHMGIFFGVTKMICSKCVLLLVQTNVICSDVENVFLFYFWKKMHTCMILRALKTNNF